MKAKEIREKSETELNQELNSLYREQFNLRMQKGTGATVKSHLLAKVRKTIARIKTILSERQQ